MSQVAVVTDSTASLPERMCERYQILMVPYCVHLGGRVARDMVDIKQEEFNVYLAGLPDGSELPRTATPGPGDYVRALGAAAKRAEENISFHVTSLGSGAYQAALVARDTVLKRLQGTRMKVVDTRNVSMGHGWMALQAARASASGASLGDIVEMVRKMIPVTRMIQTADTLRYLYMGGASDEPNTCWARCSRSSLSSAWRMGSSWPWEWRAPVWPPTAASPRSSGKQSVMGRAFASPSPTPPRGPRQRSSAAWSGR